MFYGSGQYDGRRGPSGLPELPFKKWKPPVCKCGRPNGAVPHCPNCGTSNVYGVEHCTAYLPVHHFENDEAGTPVISEAGQPAIAMLVANGFRCRKCKTYFNEAMECQAETPITKQEKQISTKKREQAERTAAFKASLPNAVLPSEFQEALALVAEERAKHPRPLSPEKAARLAWFRGQTKPPNKQQNQNASMKDDQSLPPLE